MLLRNQASRRREIPRNSQFLGCLLRRTTLPQDTSRTLPRATTGMYGRQRGRKKPLQFRAQFLKPRLHSTITDWTRFNRLLSPVMTASARRESHLVWRFGHTADGEEEN